MLNRIQSSLKNPLAMTILSTVKTSAAGYKTVTHCVFDMDGLLLGKFAFEPVFFFKPLKIRFFQTFVLAMLAMPTIRRHRLCHQNWMIQLDLKKQIGDTQDVQR